MAAARLMPLKMAKSKASSGLRVCALAALFHTFSRKRAKNGDFSHFVFSRLSLVRLFIRKRQAYCIQQMPVTREDDVLIHPQSSIAPNTDTNSHVHTRNS